MANYNNHNNQFIQLADLKLGGLPEHLSFKGDEFIVKSEFHITIIGVERIAKLIDSDDSKQTQQQIVDIFNAYIREHPLDQYELIDDLRLVEVDGNRTIVVMVELRGIDEFYAELSHKLSFDVPVQPAHITLYTLPTDTFGIPISSYEELEKISKSIRLPQLHPELPG